MRAIPAHLIPMLTVDVTVLLDGEPVALYERAVLVGGATDRVTVRVQHVDEKGGGVETARRPAEVARLDARTRLAIGGMEQQLPCVPPNP